MRHAALLLAVASTLACDARRDRIKRTAPLVLSQASAEPAAPSVGSTFLPLAHAARDAATKVASGCRLLAAWGETHIRYFDRCTFLASDLASLRAAATSLGAAPAGANGDALVFAEEVRLFTAWVDLVKDGETTGTLSHYQGLASAWNTLQPSDRIPVDLRTKDAFSGAVIVAGEGGKLVWGRCSTGPCILVPRKDL